MIREVNIKDAKQIISIYNYYIKHTTISFETSIITVKEMEKRIQKITLKYPWIVYLKNNNILGYAYATEWKARSAYKKTVEVTFYVKQANLGKGIGSVLCKELLSRLKEKKFHSAVACIALPNDRSIAFHEKFGFKKVAHFHEIGHKFDKRIDVGYWELIIGSD